MSVDRERLPEYLADLTLTPATRLLWRSPDSVHLERAGSGVVVDGLPPAVVADLAAPERPGRSRPPKPTPWPRSPWCRPGATMPSSLPAW